MVSLFRRLPLGGKLCHVVAVMRGGYIYDSQNFQTKGRQPVFQKKITAQSIKKGRFAVKRLLITLSLKFS